MHYGCAWQRLYPAAPLAGSAAASTQVLSGSSPIGHRPSRKLLFFVARTFRVEGQTETVTLRKVAAMEVPRSCSGSALSSASNTASGIALLSQSNFMTASPDS